MINLLLIILFSPNTTIITYPSVEFEAYVTAYSRQESCHNPGCLNAMGRKPKMWDVACPRWLPLGTKVLFMGYQWLCADRYAKWIDSERDLPTFDIFSTDYQSAVDWGLQKATIKVLQ